MPEYVDREAIKKYPIRLNNYDKKNGNYHFVLGIESVMEYVDGLPIADVQEVKHGKWIYDRTYYEADECNCSLCGQLMTTAKGVRTNYCPNCGARMDKE